MAGVSLTVPESIDLADVRVILEMVAVILTQLNMYTPRDRSRIQAGVWLILSRTAVALEGARPPDREALQAAVPEEPASRRYEPTARGASLRLVHYRHT